MWLIEPDVFQLPQLHKHFNVSGNHKSTFMKKTLIILFATILFSCQDQSKSTIRPEQHFLSKDKIDSAVRHLEDFEWSKASVRKDTQWFQAHIANELIMTTGRTGEVTNKQQTIEEIKDTAYDSGGSDKVEDLKILSHENTAVATFKILTNGKDKTGSYYRIARYTEVWIFRDDRWQLLASHSSLLPTVTNADIAK